MNINPKYLARPRPARAAVKAAALAAVLLLPWSAASAAAVGLASHRAVYDLHLKAADERSGISAVVGRLVMEFGGDACDGYTLNMRRVLKIDTEAGSNTFDALTTSWESGEGDQMQFGTRQYVGTTLLEEVAGTANSSDDGGSVTYSAPADQEHELPADTVFPVEHTQNIIDAARDGQVIQRSVVFDGAEVGKVYTAVSFIGHRQGPGAADVPDTVSGSEYLEDLPSWPVTVSYYEDTAEDTSEQVPSYELSVTMFENGIATDLVMAYEGFSLNGDLSELEVFESEDCR